MNRKFLRLATGMLGVTLACWGLASLLADRIVRDEFGSTLRAQRQVARSVIDGTAEVIANDLAMSRAIPATLAETALVQHTLAQNGRFAAGPTASADAAFTRRNALLKTPQLAAFNHFLHDAQGFSGFDTLWLVDADGFCIAASDAGEPASPIGADLRAQPYIANALLGAFAESYGADGIAGEPGIYIAAPVYDDGTLVGALVAKTGLSRLRHWVVHPGTFVTDANGVIIMAHDTALEGMALPGAHVDTLGIDERLATYRQTRFETYALKPAAAPIREQAPWLPRDLAGQLQMPPGHATPALYEVSSGENSSLAANIVDPLTAWPAQLAAHRRNHLLIFVTLWVAAALAAVIAIAWVRERQLRHEAFTLADRLRSANTLLTVQARDDTLTGALTRRYFVDLLQHQIDNAQVTGRPLCLALADLDHFKQINDRYGHAAGDVALRHFVDVCRIAMRGDDAIGRIGGEEFGLVLPATSLAAGHQAVERLRRRLQGQRVDGLPADLTLTVSIGVTALGPHDTPDTLMRRADAALYRAKEAGRNRSVAVEPEDAQQVE